MKSHFVDNCEKLTKPKIKFERWLLDRGFDAVGSSSYAGATHAAALVDEFLDDFPEFLRYSDSVEEHADDIGFVSDAEEDLDDIDDSDEPESRY